MIADRRLPVMVAAMTANGPGLDRRLEYRGVIGIRLFAGTHILPHVEKETGVTLTKDPDGRMTYGSGEADPHLGAGAETISAQPPLRPIGAIG